MSSQDIVMTNNEALDMEAPAPPKPIPEEPEEPDEEYFEPTELDVDPPAYHQQPQRKPRQYQPEGVSYSNGVANMDYNPYQPPQPQMRRGSNYFQQSPLQMRSQPVDIPYNNVDPYYGGPPINQRMPPPPTDNRTMRLDALRAQMFPSR